MNNDTLCESNWKGQLVVILPGTWHKIADSRLFPILRNQKKIHLIAIEINEMSGIQ